jgi:Domain of unknown function (DUF932)
MTTALVLHKGGRLCDFDELSQLPTPPPEGRWHPVSHARVVEVVTETLTASGFEVHDRRLAIAREGKRFFGTLILKTPLTPQKSVSLAVGIRNSVDKSFPLGFCAGHAVFVCDNLAFRSELLVRRRHTRFGESRFQTAIGDAVQQLGVFQQAEETRIARLMGTDLTDDQALAFFVRAMEKGIIAPPLLPKLLAEWRVPAHDYGTQDRRTAWRLLNCFTTVLGPRAVKAPQQYASQTIRLNALLPQPNTWASSLVKEHLALPPSPPPFDLAA